MRVKHVARRNFLICLKRLERHTMRSDSYCVMHIHLCLPQLVLRLNPQSQWSGSNLGMLLWLFQVDESYEDLWVVYVQSYQIYLSILKEMSRAYSQSTVFIAQELLSLISWHKSSCRMPRFWRSFPSPLSSGKIANYAMWWSTCSNVQILHYRRHGRTTFDSSRDTVASKINLKPCSTPGKKMRDVMHYCLWPIWPELWRGWWRTHFWHMDGCIT